MVTFGSTSETSTEMRKYTRDLYARLEAETGQATGFKPVGFIEVAADPDRLEEYRRVVRVQPLLRRRRARDLARRGRGAVPARATSTTSSPASTSKEDGRVEPGRRHDGARARARGMQGATIIEGDAGDRRARRSAARSPACATPYGDIEAEYVVNCAGMWARQLGEQAGVNIPLQAAEHYYLITEPIEGMHGDLPVLEDPSLVRLLPRGGRRPDDRPVRADLRAVEGRRHPEDFSFGEIPPDWERMGPYLEKAMARVPISIEVGVTQVLLRSGELHARPAADRRRGAGAARTTSSPPGSTRSASSPAAASAA